MRRLSPKYIRKYVAAAAAVPPEPRSSAAYWRSAPRTVGRSAESWTSGWGTTVRMRTNATAITPANATNGVRKSKATASARPSGIPRTSPNGTPLMTHPLAHPRRSYGNASPT